MLVSEGCKDGRPRSLASKDLAAQNLCLKIGRTTADTPNSDHRNSLHKSFPKAGLPRHPLFDRQYTPLAPRISGAESAKQNSCDVKWSAVQVRVSKPLKICDFRLQNALDTCEAPESGPNLSRFMLGANQCGIHQTWQKHHNNTNTSTNSNNTI